MKKFQKLDLREGILQNEGANRFIKILANILKSVSVQQNHVSSVHLDGSVDFLEGYENISPQDIKRLRNMVKSSHSVCLNTSCKSCLPFVG